MKQSKIDSRTSINFNLYSTPQQIQSHTLHSHTNTLLFSFLSFAMNTTTIEASITTQQQQQQQQDQQRLQE